MVTFVPDFVNAECAAWKLALHAAGEAQGLDVKVDAGWPEFRASWSADHPAPTATLADVVAHCEHVRAVAGIDHIGLGGDYDGVDRLPEGLEDVAGYPRLLAALAERGWSESDLDRLAHGNILRVMREVEAAAARIRTERGPSQAVFSR